MEFGDHTERHFAKTSEIDRTGAPVWVLLTVINIILMVIVFHWVEIVWMTSFWKLISGVLSGLTIGLVLSVLGQRWIMKLMERRRTRDREAQALVKERELVKFQATKAWPSK